MKLIINRDDFLEIECENLRIAEITGKTHIESSALAEELENSRSGLAFMRMLQKVRDWQGFCDGIMGTNSPFLEFGDAERNARHKDAWLTGEWVRGYLCRNGEK